MKLSKKNQQLLLTLVILLLWTIFVPRELELEEPKETPIQVSETALPPAWQVATVTRVVDGDTIEIAGGQKVRYIGIDTPETVDPRQEVQCFGQEASNRNKELVAGQEIFLEKDVSETDRYGRLLRYVYLATDSASVNEQLVSEGFAKASSYPPDVRYQEKFKAAEEDARAKQRGLWQEDLACESG
jgi:micrococcal nuclease